MNTIRLENYLNREKSAVKSIPKNSELSSLMFLITLHLQMQTIGFCIEIITQNLVTC